MGLLDDAIREHLELKRRHGADSNEIARLEHEAFGPPRRGDVETVAPTATAPADEAHNGNDHVHEKPHLDDSAPTQLHAVEDEHHPHLSDAPPPHGDPADALPHAAAHADTHAETAPAPAPAPAPARPPRPRSRRASSTPTRSAPPPARSTSPHPPSAPRRTSRARKTATCSRRRRSSSRRHRSTTASGSSSAPRGTSISEYSLTWLDVFTSTPMAGNGLAVVHDADDVSDETMLAFAQETKLSETTFVQAGDDECDYRNRIWMRTGELPMAGHPSLGTAVAVARRRGEDAARFVQRTPAGLQPVVVELDGRVARASMLQEPADFGDELDPARVLGAIGLSAGDADPALPCQRVATGVGQVLAPVRDAEALARATPDAAAVAALLDELQAITIYAAVCDAEAGRADARSFFPSPGGIVEEDPATGSAAGPLMVYLHARAGIEALTIDQGVQMGRPSRLDASIEGDRPRVGGEVVTLAEGVVTF